MSNDHKSYPVSEHFRQLADAMPQVVWIADTEGRLLYRNDRMKELPDLQLLPDGTWDWAELLHPDDHATTYQAWQQSIEKHTSYEITHHIRMRSGEYRWILSRANPQMDSSGQVTYWYGTATDVHAQRLMLEKLQRSEAEFRAIFEISNAGLVEANVQGQFIRANRAFAQFLGYSLEELLGMTIDEVTHPDFRILHVQKFHDLVYHGKILVQEKQYVRKDGNTVWGLVTGNPIFDRNGRLIHTVAVIQDVTGKKLIEQELQRSEQQMRLLAESIPQLVWLMNREGECEFSNKRWEEYSGLKNEGRDIWQKILHPDDLRRIASIWRKGLHTEEPIRDVLRLLNRDGEYRWHSMTGEPIRDEQGEIIRWISVCSDIHEQKTSAERLEMLVAQRTKELQRSNEDLQQFAHVASHDMKEPLRKIKIFGSRLRDEYGDELPEKARLYLEKIESAANRMFSMVDGVLQYSMINGTLQQTELFDLNEIFSNIEADLEVRIQQTSARLHYKDLPMVKGAPVLIYQLFFNLVSNALKFQKPGQIPEIEVHSSVVNRVGKLYTCIELRDNGIGFEQEYAEKIFNSFSRLHSKDSYEGTGLGLALCKKIVERHHGFIEAVGQSGVGATFTVYLPQGNPGELV